MTSVYMLVQNRAILRNALQSMVSKACRTLGVWLLLLLSAVTEDKVRGLEQMMTEGSLTPLYALESYVSCGSKEGLSEHVLS